MKFPIVPEEFEQFYQFLHTHADSYSFPGGYQMVRCANNLWSVIDNIGYRLTDCAVWVGCPREEDKLRNPYLVNDELIRVCKVNLTRYAERLATLTEIIRLPKLIKERGARCECWGSAPGDGVTVINVDHIKPRRDYPHLAMEKAKAYKW